MPPNAYAKWVAPAILFFFLCVALGFWTHKLRHPAPAPPAASPTLK
ncbi:MAG: hypothetical protein JO250_23940 [Armatimonadetes bacterium]|nr:hypothetical protein [Armatimonadota bacterium]